MDYFLQKDDVDQSWTLNGHDVRPDDDPDGTDAITYIGNKWSNPNCYEVFKVTPDELQLRYEVVRSDPITGHGNWIRRYQEIGDGHGELPGQCLDASTSGDRWDDLQDAHDQGPLGL